MHAVITTLLTAEGSTRTAALMRIGLPLLIWSRLGSHFLLYKHHEPLRVLLMVSFFLSTSARLIGGRSRLSSACTGLTMMAIYYWMGMVNGVGSYTHHHIYVLAIAPLLLACTECGRSWSWDRWRALRRGEAPPERGPTWGLVLITVQLSQIYLWSAVSKCSGAFLSGERLEQIFLRLYVGSDYPDFPGCHQLMIAGAVVAIVLEVVLAVGLFMRRTHRWLLPLGIFFHAFMYVTLPVAPFTASICLL